MKIWCQKAFLWKIYNVIKYLYNTLNYYSKLGRNVQRGSANFALFMFSDKILAENPKNGCNLGVQRLAFWMFVHCTYWPIDSWWFRIFHRFWPTFRISTKFQPNFIISQNRPKHAPARPADLTYLPDITIGIGQFFNSCDV